MVDADADVAAAVPTIRQRLEADMRTAMRAGDTVTRDAVRYILAAVKNAEIDLRDRFSEAEAQAAVRRLGKQLADAADQYRAGGRDDLADKEGVQLAVLRCYLPVELSDDELAAVVAEAVAAVGATGPKEMGKVMPVALERAGGRVDGRRLSAAVKATLTGG